MSSILARPGVRQLAKFCIVGFSSFVIDFGLFNLLHFKGGWGIGGAKTLSFLVAVCNGFYWNRRWTFQANGGDAKAQYPKFLLTNTIGLVLNLTMMTVAIIEATNLGFIHTHRTPQQIIELLVSGSGKQEFPGLVLNGALVVATAVVMMWNFTAARLWTFRPKAA